MEFEIDVPGLIYRDGYRRGLATALLFIVLAYVLLWYMHVRAYAAHTPAFTQARAADTPPNPPPPDKAG
jgi:hypothetical protein